MEQFALLNEKWHGVCYVLSMLRFTVTQAAQKLQDKERAMDNWMSQV